MQAYKSEFEKRKVTLNSKPRHGLFWTSDAAAKGMTKAGAYQLLLALASSQHYYLTEGSTDIDSDSESSSDEDDSDSL